MLFVSLPGPSRAELLKQLNEAETDADAIEIRCDLLDDWDEPFLRDCIRRSPHPVLLTLRSTKQGGAFQGDYQAACQKLAACQPVYLDIEHPADPAFLSEIKQQYPSVKLLLSHHGDGNIPQMESPHADLYKIALGVTKSTEILRACRFLQNKPSTLLLTMNDVGIPGRILPRVFGSVGSFACLNEQHRVAPGQLTLDEMHQIYHYPSLNKGTTICALIGNPVIQSEGHLFHNHYYEEHNLNAVYLKFQVETEEVGEFLSLAKELGFRGLSVTMPHKETVIPFLDELTEEAQQMQAVNTIVFEKGKAIGTNTDGIGAWKAIEQYTPVKGKQTIILGAGGAAKAIASTLVQKGGNVTILNRSPDRAREVAERLGCAWAGLEQLPSLAPSADVIVQTTPTDVALDPTLVRPSTLIMDIRTRDQPKKFLAPFKEKGCPTANGKQMFQFQALEQIRLWF